MYYYNGGGLGVGDLNNDGLQDLVFSSNTESEKVYINKGNLRFEDLSDKVNIDGGENAWSNGVAIADVNGDGLLDVYLSQVCGYRNLSCTNKLFICTGISEDGIPQYEDQAEAFGLNFAGFSTQAGFFDYDRDGDLDMYLMNHSLHHNGTFGQRKDFTNTYDKVSGDRLYRNDGNTFTDVTRESGINSSVIGYGLGLSFGDVNNDGWTDIYIGNDFHENDYLYINQKDGTFKDQLTEKIKHTSRFSMGVDIADLNNDGLQDIVSLDMLPEDPFILKSSEGEDALDIFRFKLGYGYNHQYARNALQLNQENGHFKEIAAYAGIHATDWSWSPLVFDFDMDGTKDIFISNGIPKRMNDIDYINFISGNEVQYKIQFNQLEEKDLEILEKIPEIKLRNKFYLGNETLRFKDMASAIGSDKESFSNAAAFADLDNDGDYDIICNNINDAAFIYENKCNPSNVRQIILKTNDKNTAAIGAQIQAKYPNKTIQLNHSATKGFQSSMITKIWVPADSLQELTIRWSNGLITKEVVQEGHSPVVIAQDKAKDIEPKNKSLQDNLRDVTSKYGIALQHKENPFIEFNREPLIPFSTSTDGPALAVGDINNDGLDDFYLGSSKRKWSSLMVQQKDGSFDALATSAFSQDSICEETDAAFIDVDGDGDQDLIIATGGNEYKLGSPYTQPKLFVNDKGQFTLHPKAFENIYLTASCIRPHDFDGDGDLDIFIGARAVPRSYGEMPRSYILENNGSGIFTPVEKWQSICDDMGFVKDATWVSSGKDAPELWFVSEWEPIRKIIFDDTPKMVALTKEKGLWNCIHLCDVDGDGDKDLFAGNVGLNSRLQASAKEPIRMYFADFDDNGVKEQILSYYIDGREIPFSNMMELQKQIPILKKKYLYAKDFAKASIEELVSKNKIKEGTTFSADMLENSLYLTENGSLTKASLPKEMQYTSVYEIAHADIDKDGDLDLIPGGNYHHCNVQMGRYDTENGAVLINDGAGNFTYQILSENPTPGEVKHIKAIRVQNKPALLVAQNNEALKLLEIIHE